MARWSWLESLGVFKGKIFTESWNGFGVKPPFSYTFKNMAWDVLRGVNQMRGLGTVNTTGMSNPLTYIERYEAPDSSTYTLVAEGTKLWKHTGVGVPTEIKAGLTSSYQNLFRGTQLQFNRIMTNGVDSMLEWEGTTVFDLGNPAPDQSAMVAAETNDGAGVLADGTYKYRVTFVNDDDSSNESIADTVNAVSVVISSGPSDVALTVIPLGATANNCTSRRLYRTEVDGDTYYFLATIADNTTTTYADTTADADLTTTSTPPSDNNTCLAASLDVEMFYNTLFTVGTGTNRNKLYWAKQNFPDILPAFNFKVFNTPIRFAKVQGDFLWVYLDDAIWKIVYEGIYGGISNDYVDANGAYAFSFHEVVNGIGGHKQAKAISNVIYKGQAGQMFIDENSYLSFFNGYNVIRIGERRWDAIAENELNYASLYYHQPSEEVMIVEATNASGGVVYVYNVQHDAFRTIEGTDATLTGIAHRNTQGNYDRLWIGAHDGGLLERNFVTGGSSLFGADAIVSEIDTGWLDFGAPESNKQITDNAQISVVVSSGLRHSADNSTTINYEVFFSPDAEGKDYTDSASESGTITLTNESPDFSFKVETINTPRDQWQAVRFKFTHSESGKSWGLHDIIVNGIEGKGVAND